MTKPRDYRQVAAAFRENLDAHIEQHPDAFEVNVYIPVAGSAETVAENEDVVGALDSEEREISFSDPIEARAVRLPGDFGVDLVDSGDDLIAGESPEPIILLLSVRNIPKGTVIQYLEYLDEDEQEQIITMRVQESKALGGSPIAGKKHYCIPFRQMTA